MEDELIRRQVLLERLKTGEVNHFAVYLKKIENSLREQLLAEDITQFNRSRLERKIWRINKLLTVIFNDFYEALAPRLTDIAEYESTLETKTLSKNCAGKLQFDRPDVKQLRAMFQNHPFSLRGNGAGKLLKSFVKDWSQTEKDRVAGVIRQGYFEGKTTPQIVRDVVGNTKSSEIKRIKRNAATIVRTSVQHVSNVARAEVWKANESLIDGYVLVATLDGVTTIQCRSLDGMLFELGKGPIPPLHPNCRTTSRAELKEQYQLLSEGRTRASKNGPVSGKLSYYAWLKTQNKQFQDMAIGRTRALLFREGGLSADAFAKLNLNRNFEPLTLDEMRAKEPLVFERAGI